MGARGGTAKMPRLKARARWVARMSDDGMVPTLNDLARRHTALTSADIDWLHALVSDWQLLADLSFADLVLWAPLQDASGWVVLAQMRPTTGPTTFHDDAVGSFAPVGARPFLESAQRERRICREGDPEWTSGVPVRHESIPVTREGQVIAVIERSTNLSSARTPSRLELTYLKGADDLAQMVAAGMFPWPGQEPVLVRSPRVGDGLLRLGRSGKVSYASPNALSAYRRLGLTADLVGAELGPLTARLCAPGRPTDDSLMVTASGRAPRETEVEGNGSVVQLRAIPLRRQRAADRGAGPGARRDRAAAPRARADDQRCHHPGNPPPGEEQPADRGRTAAPAVTAAGGAQGPGGAGRGGAPGRVHRDRARDAFARPGRDRGLR